MQKNLKIGNLIASIFKENWNDDFIFDAQSGVSLTYGDFLNKALAYKEKLMGLGASEGDVIVLILNNSIEFAILYFSILLAGLVAVPVDPLKGSKEKEEILQQAKAKIIIQDADQDISIGGRKINLSFFREFHAGNLKIEKENIEFFERLNYEKLFLIIFTSGSTGAPKGVMHSFKNLIQSALSFASKFNFGKENIFYHNLPMTYMAGILNQMLMPFICGSKIVIGDRFSISNVNKFWKYSVQYSVNTFWFNPTILSLLMKLDRGEDGVGYASGRKIIGCVGTAPLDYHLKQDFEKKYKIALYESYGLSETLFISTENPGEKKVKGSVGRKLDGVNISFAADNEILLEAEWMFLGYINKDSGEIFTNNKFLSGDLGHIDKEDFLHITGRKKDLIIKGGINVSPKKIEDFVNKFDFFEECVIMGVEDEIFGEKIVCFYMPDRENYNGKSEKKLNNEIVEKLGRDYKIDEFCTLEEIPKNINGKVNRLRLRKIYFKAKKNDN